MAEAPWYVRAAEEAQARADESAVQSAMAVARAEEMREQLDERASRQPG